MKSGWVKSEQLYGSMSSYQLKTKFWTKFGPKKALNEGLKFFRVPIPPESGRYNFVYHDMQNEKSVEYILIIIYNNNAN